MINMICPFHEDSNPSMVMYGDAFFCFVCKRSGHRSELPEEATASTSRLKADRELLKNDVLRLIGALAWCSGAAAFQEGGLGREGWTRGPAKLLEEMRERAARRETVPFEKGMTWEVALRTGGPYWEFVDTPPMRKAPVSVEFEPGEPVGDSLVAPPPLPPRTCEWKRMDPGTQEYRVCGRPAPDWSVDSPMVNQEGQHEKAVCEECTIKARESFEVFRATKTETENVAIPDIVGGETPQPITNEHVQAAREKLRGSTGVVADRDGKISRSDRYNARLEKVQSAGPARVGPIGDTNVHAAIGRLVIAARDYGKYAAGKDRDTAESAMRAANEDLVTLIGTGDEHEQAIFAEVSETCRKTVMKGGRERLREYEDALGCEAWRKKIFDHLTEMDDTPWRTRAVEAMATALRWIRALDRAPMKNVHDSLEAFTNPAVHARKGRDRTWCDLETTGLVCASIPWRGTDGWQNVTCSACLGLRVRDDKLLERDLIEVHLKTIVHFLDFTEAVGTKELIDEVVQAIQTRPTATVSHDLNTEAQAQIHNLRRLLRVIADRLYAHLEGKDDTSLVRNARTAAVDARKVASAKP